MLHPTHPSNIIFKSMLHEKQEKCGLPGSEISNKSERSEENPQEDEEGLPGHVLQTRVRE